jgi:hypothetical protein
MEKIGSGIWDKHPGSATLNVRAQKFRTKKIMPCQFIGGFGPLIGCFFTWIWILRLAMKQ